MSRPVCLITGTTSGIGRVAARRIAEAGFDLVMACRNPEKALRLRDELIDQTSNSNISVLECNLASLDSVRHCTAAFQQRFDRLDLLVNNAGLMANKPQVSDDGFEMTFACNHLGPFLLTLELLDTIKASSPARIVNVASAVHRMGELDLDNLIPGKRYRGMKAYARSKLANVCFTLSLADRLKNTGVTVNCLHPGVVATNIIPDTSPWLKLGGRLVKAFMFDEERGAATTLHLALSKDLNGVTGRYFNEHGKIMAPAPQALDSAARERLWRVSERITGLISAETPRQTG